MKNLYFIRSNGEMVLVKEDITEETAIKEINAYVEKLNPNYTIYYVRTWYNEDFDGTMYDIGSHTEFFLVKKE